MDQPSIHCPFFFTLHIKAFIPVWVESLVHDCSSIALFPIHSYHGYSSGVTPKRGINTSSFVKRELIKGQFYIVLPKGSGCLKKRLFFNNPSTETIVKRMVLVSGIVEDIEGKRLYCVAGYFQRYTK